MRGYRTDTDHAVGIKGIKQPVPVMYHYPIFEVFEVPEMKILPSIVRTGRGGRGNINLSVHFRKRGKKKKPFLECPSVCQSYFPHLTVSFYCTRRRRKSPQNITIWRSTLKKSLLPSLKEEEEDPKFGSGFFFPVSLLRPQDQ